MIVRDDCTEARMSEAGLRFLDLCDCCLPVNYAGVLWGWVGACVKSSTAHNVQTRDKHPSVM